jgi:hypothetical protein
MEFHEVCNLFPEMTPDEFAELKADIAKMGQLEPIWTYQDQIAELNARLCSRNGFSQTST